MADPSTEQAAEGGEGGTEAMHGLQAGGAVLATATPASHRTRRREWRGLCCAAYHCSACCEAQRCHAGYIWQQTPNPSSVAPITLQRLQAGCGWRGGQRCQ